MRLQYHRPSGRFVVVEAKIYFVIAVKFTLLLVHAANKAPMKKAPRGALQSKARTAYFNQPVMAEEMEEPPALTTPVISFSVALGPVLMGRPKWSV